MVLFVILLLVAGNEFSLQASDRPLYVFNEACVNRLRTICALLDVTALDRNCPNAEMVQKYLELKGHDALQAITDDMILIDVLARLTTERGRSVTLNPQEMVLCSRAIESYFERRFCQKKLEEISKTTLHRTPEVPAIQSPAPSRKHMCECIIL